jgi:hypothetical protein
LVSVHASIISHFLPDDTLLANNCSDDKRTRLLAVGRKNPEHLFEQK